MYVFSFANCEKVSFFSRNSVATIKEIVNSW
jgi:hypothetical protein